VLFCLGPNVTWHVDVFGLMGFLRIQASLVLTGSKQSAHTTCCPCFLAIQRAQVVANSPLEDAVLRSLLGVQTSYVLIRREHVPDAACSLRFQAIHVGNVVPLHASIETTCVCRRGCRDCETRDFTLVDEIVKEVGGTATIFARSGADYCARDEAIAAIDEERTLTDVLNFDPSKPAKYPNGRSSLTT
jgi:hypothetical protein